MNLSDLLNGCIKGHRKSQDFLYEKYAGRLYFTCLRYIQNNEEAQDVLQESLIKIYKNIQNFDNDNEGAFWSWMNRIAVNTALNHIRDNKRFEETDISELENVLGFSEEEEECDSSLFSTVSSEKILQIIQELPSGYKIVFNMYVFEDFSHKEIAEKLNISINTSKTQLFKARKLILSKINQIIDNKLVKQAI